MRLLFSWSSHREQQQQVEFHLISSNSTNLFDEFSYISVRQARGLTLSFNTDCPPSPKQDGANKKSHRRQQNFHGSINSSLLRHYWNCNELCDISTVMRSYIKLFWRRAMEMQWVWCTNLRGSSWGNQDGSVWRRWGSGGDLIPTTPWKEVLVSWESASSPR